MKKLVLALIAAAAWSAAASADEGPYIDVDAIDSVEDVKPVDGLRAAGQPDAEDLRIFREAGYVAVIDIRGPDENRGMDEKAVAEQLGLEYVTLPIVGSSAINFENADRLDELLEQYQAPVLVHCGSSNRVGALLALRKSLNGASSGEALEYGRSAGLKSLEPVVEDRLGDAP